ncbi:glycosyltransferase family 2 protein [Rhodopila sp.]|uniref:glycosyltransferase family 2 protein n=1 Tax=Rhodopila sp. TaxID=2480087 RepID=UPI003D09A73F
MSSPKISAFVICYNRADLLATCLRALAFADELIVVDKSSTDHSRLIAETLATRVVTVPWTPTVEETRTLALSLCRHEWVLFMDDDECLSPEAARLIQAEVLNPSADIYAFPQRHYILGVHDERAYYWPEHQIRLFRRGAVTFSRTVHAGIVRHSDRMLELATKDGVCIHHLSHPDVSSWIEKTNRYTSRPDRVGCPAASDGLAAFAHQRIDHWMGCTRDDDPNGYPAAVALLRAVYDMVDALKTWETERGLAGAALFKQVCNAFDAAREQKADSAAARRQSCANDLISGCSCVDDQPKSVPRSWSTILDEPTGKKPVEDLLSLVTDMI